MRACSEIRVDRSESIATVYSRSFLLLRCLELESSVAVYTCYKLAIEDVSLCHYTLVIYETLLGNTGKSFRPLIIPEYGS